MKGKLKRYFLLVFLISGIQGLSADDRHRGYHKDQGHRHAGSYSHGDVRHYGPRRGAVRLNTYADRHFYKRNYYSRYPQYYSYAPDVHRYSGAPRTYYGVAPYRIHGYARIHPRAHSSYCRH